VSAACSSVSSLPESAATCRYFQENLKYVRDGQRSRSRSIPIPDRFQGNSWPDLAGECGRSVSAERCASGVRRGRPHQALGQFAVQIHFDDNDQEKFPIGAHGVAAIYTSGGGFAVLRKISIRAHTWLNWLYPLNV